MLGAKGGVKCERVKTTLIYDEKFWETVGKMKFKVSHVGEERRRIKGGLAEMTKTLEETGEEKSEATGGASR